MRQRCSAGRPQEVSIRLCPNTDVAAADHKTGSPQLARSWSRQESTHPVLLAKLASNVLLLPTAAAAAAENSAEAPAAGGAAAAVSAAARTSSGCDRARISQEAGPRLHGLQEFCICQRAHVKGPADAYDVCMDKHVCKVTQRSAGWRRQIFSTIRLQRARFNTHALARAHHNQLQ
jgi:hypothetical protein